MAIQVSYDKPNAKVVINVLDDSTQKVVGGAPLSFDDADKFAAYVAEFSRQARADNQGGGAARPAGFASDPAATGKDGDPIQAMPNPFPAKSSIAPGDDAAAEADKSRKLAAMINDQLANHPIIAKVNGLLDGLLGGGGGGGLLGGLLGGNNNGWNNGYGGGWGGGWGGRGPWGGRTVVVQQPVVLGGAQPVWGGVAAAPVYAGGYAGGFGGLYGAQPVWGGGVVAPAPVWGGGVVAPQPVFGGGVIGGGMVGGYGAQIEYATLILQSGQQLRCQVSLTPGVAAFQGQFI